MSIQKPRAILCDVNGTLFGLDALGERMTEVGLPKSALAEWFAKVLREGEALSVTGKEHFASCEDVCALQLKLMLRKHQSSLSTEQLGNAVSTVMGGWHETVAWPDVKPGFEGLKKAGVQIATMTNGSIKVTDSFLKRHDLSGHVTEVMEIAQVGLWKPRAEVYHYAAKRLGLQPSEVMLAAVHPWDTHGAKAAGLQTAYIDRDGEEYPPYFLPPDVTVPSFVALAERLQG